MKESKVITLILSEWLGNSRWSRLWIETMVRLTSIQLATGIKKTGDDRESETKQWNKVDQYLNQSGEATSSDATTSEKEAKRSRTRKRVGSIQLRRAGKADKVYFR